MTNNVFVTVGSTRFDRLIAAISSPPFLAQLLSLGYTHLTVQHGQSPFPTSLSSLAHDLGLHLDAYTYKSSLRDDMERASLIISHAGSGSILEALRLNKNLIVVVNEDLMDNHQQELGSALHEQGHLVCCSVSGLENALREKKYESLVPYPEPDPTRFANFLNTRMGV
ncbi:N-acetylglucosaminyldiphosphodolichol N-acetylglucosaminyltransferase catalytic subunit alg13 [Dissophora globulifera]|nr:N-acetylglucosaminyldiphosphodolichol N-acetylglucosaminyltransferase catalytic subunit alg13 [Dissophora globulifera]